MEAEVVEDVEISPMSFSEFVQSLQVDVNSFDPEDIKTEKLLQRYLKFGGLPIVSRSNDEDILEKLLDGIFCETFLKNIIIKYSIRNVATFYSVLKFLVQNIGKPIKMTAISDYCSKSNTPTTIFTIDNYVSIIEKSSLFKKILRYDINNGSFVNGGESFFCADTGLANAVMDFKFFDETALMKNVVCLEFLRRGYNVYSARVGSMNTDFLASLDDEIICVQILPVDDSKKISALLRPLNKLPDQIGKFLISKYPVKIKKSSVKNLTLSDFLFNNNNVSPLYIKKRGV